MGRSGGDGTPGAGPVPGGEPEPVELWIAGSSPNPPGGATGPAGGPPARPPGNDAGHGRSGGGAAGTPGVARWIALIAGFAVLVAIVAVQHFAGGHPAATIAPTSSAPAAPSLSRASTGPAAGSVPSSPSARPTQSPSSADSSEPGPSSDGRYHTTPVRPTDSTEPGTGDSVTDSTSPLTTSVRAHVLPGASGWELVGYGSFGLVRYAPATGAVTLTPVPPVQSTGPLSLVATTSGVIIRPLDAVPGYLIPRDGPARALPGLLAAAVQVFPGPNLTHLWVADVMPDSLGGRTITLVDLHGRPSGPAIHVPAALGGYSYSYQSDGRGNVLVQGVGGTYDARPDGLHLVTHGMVLAQGPTAFLVYECSASARCTTVLIDRATGHRTTLPGLTVTNPNIAGGGVISPDGHLAAVIENTVGTGVDATAMPVMHLIDLRTGVDHRIGIRVNGDYTQPPQVIAFSPDGRYLLAATASGQIAAVNTGTRAIIRLPHPIPPTQMLVVAAPGRPVAGDGS